MKIYKESVYLKLARQLRETENRRDANFENYKKELIGMEEYLREESILVIKARNLNLKMENLESGLPENGYGNYITPQKGGSSSSANHIDTDI